MRLKCAAALVLTLGLIAVAVYSISQGIIGTLPALGLGIGLGTTYVVRGGSLPAWAYRWVRGRVNSLEPDGHASHLPARVYLPILLTVIGFGGAAVLGGEQMRMPRQARRCPECGTIPSE